MKNFRTLIATIALTFTALILAPTAASAQYQPTGPEGGTITAAPGETFTVTFSGFEPNEDVLFTLTGENAAGATMASLATVVNSQSITKTADANGTAAVTITLPDNAVGEYTLTAEGLSSGAEAAVTIIVVGAPGATTPTRSGTLPATGGDATTSTALAIGAVLLVGGLAVATTSVRRQRQA